MKTNSCKYILIVLLPFIMSCSPLGNSSTVSRDKTEYYINLMEVSVLSLEIWSLAPNNVNQNLATELFTKLNTSVLDVQKLGENVHKADLQRVSKLYIRMQLVARKLGKQNIEELSAAYNISSKQN
ncbi:MAG: hypothetical protein J0L60_14790 [Ignavibacteria bacterium]|nr:hypothetical protein [Ignavibacteria bacterium]